MRRPIPLAGCGSGGDLAGALAKACEKYALGGSQNRRLGSEIALVAVHSHMVSQQGISPELLRPLSELIVSLNSLDYGHDDPIFTPARTGKPRASPRREQLREVAAVAVSVLMDGGSQEDAANVHIARRLGELGVKGRCGEKISDKTVGNWRSLVTADLPLKVGRPGKLDDTRALDLALNDEHARRASVLLYLVWWRKWRRLGKPNAANAFVERILVPDMKAFLDPK